ncbi:hypothetical protein ACO0RG_001371 [Hanseniaspora osmophila]|uniref:Cell wall mannoprotein PIR3 n=1 Tax=Hanseniaspora osmophila TaxID=56408 RepID=A0A1E5R0Q2_9ASCO|nr:Cell wall mannoprotein PIR3 [Hanseniaspora osmophila]
MQFKTLLFSGLLATQVVGAAKHGHSSASSTDVVVTETTTSKSSASSAASSTTQSANATEYVGGEPWSTLTPVETYQCGFTNFNSSFGIAVKTITFNLTSATANASAFATPTGTEAAAATISTSGKSKQNKLFAPTPALDVVIDGQVRAVISKTTTDEVVTTTTLTRTQTVVMSTTTTEGASATGASHNITLIANATAVNETTHGNYTAASNTTTFNVTNMFYNSSNFNTTLLNSTAAFLNSSHFVNSTSYNSTIQCSAQLPSFFNDVSCQTNNTLSVTLQDSVLRDSLDRIGTISSGRQFQFDGPYPQTGAIYAAGWSITPDGFLALGGNDIFYECLSGDEFYNLYDEFIGSQCVPIQLEAVTLIDC